MVLVLLAWACLLSRPALAAPPDRPDFADLVPVPSFSDRQLTELAGRIGAAIIHDRPLDLPADGNARGREAPRAQVPDRVVQVVEREIGDQVSGAVECDRGASSGQQPA